jgi:hypothetical protein
VLEVSLLEGAVLELLLLLSMAAALLLYLLALDEVDGAASPGPAAVTLSLPAAFVLLLPEDNWVPTPV